jgi:8-amino-7-oxononanoate synthase
MVLGPTLEFIDRDYVRYEGRQYLYLAGVDYHRMSRHPSLAQTVADAVKQYGVGATGSRTTTGNHSLFVELESRVSQFFGSEAAVVCPSGYLSNTMILQAIEGDYDAFFMDEQAHSSLAGPAKQFGKEVYRFKHCDAHCLADQLKKHLAGKSKPLVLTDGVFPARGDIPPLKDYTDILKPVGGKILIDDAHAMAVVGASGKGSWEDQGIDREFIYQAGTLSKGFGVGGGIIPGDKRLVERIQNQSAAFVGCTSLTLPMAAAAIESVSHLLANRHVVTGLQKRATLLKQKFKNIGFSMPETCAPIFSITCNDVEKNERLKTRCLENGIYPPFINYPGSPPGGHFRFILTSSTTKDQEDLLFETIQSSL